jgi:hypothetical protein
LNTDPIIAPISVRFGTTLQALKKQVCFQIKYISTEVQLLI